jgi:8-oxo-dGTP pyrophosphatase MutT (NUDIX family)
MQRQHGPWVIRESRQVYRNPFIEVVEDRVTRPDGQPGTYGTVTMRPGVAVLPVDQEGVAYLTREFRYAIGRESIEVAGGGIDSDETAPEAARRELREELGVEASEWTDLGQVDPFTAVVHSPARLYLARGLTFTDTEHEGTEAIESVRMPFDEAVRLVMDGTITHGPSCVLILKTARVLGR